MPGRRNRCLKPDIIEAKANIGGAFRGVVANNLLVVLVQRIFHARIQLPALVERVLGSQVQHLEIRQRQDRAIEFVDKVTLGTVERLQIQQSAHAVPGHHNIE